MRAWIANFAISSLMTMIALMSAPAGAQPHVCSPGSVAEYGHWFIPEVAPFTATHLNDIIQPPGASTPGMKLLIEVNSRSEPDWNLVIRDENYRVLASVGPRDFPPGEPSSRWTGVLKAARVVVDLIAPQSSAIRVTFPEGIAYPQYSSGKLFSIVNADHPWQELYTTSQNTLAKRAGGAVGMIASAYSDASKRSAWCCTGVMISADLMLTNWHCGGSSDIAMEDSEYWSQKVCDNTNVDLNWANGGISRKFGCTSVLAKDKSLDFAVLRLGPVLGPDSAIGEPIHARLSIKTLFSGQDVFVVHHSQCMQKLVSDGCKIGTASYPGWAAAGTSIENPDFTHNCNTESGASGAPVFDENGDLIGLHHLGATGQELACEAVPGGENKAIKIDKIVQYLSENNSVLASELRLAPKTALPPAPTPKDESGVELDLRFDKSKSPTDNARSREQIVQQLHKLRQRLDQIDQASASPNEESRSPPGLNRDQIVGSIDSWASALSRFDAESQCNAVDMTEDVELYDGKLGPTQEFVTLHAPSTGQIQWNSSFPSLGPSDASGNVADVRWCTGTLISDRFFLTAGHCFDIQTGGWKSPSQKVGAKLVPLASDQIAKLMHVNFNYERDAQTRQIRAPDLYPIVRLVEHRWGQLDYAVVELGPGPDGKLPSSRFAIEGVDVSQSGLSSATILTLIQHPDGRPKVIGAGVHLGVKGAQISYSDIDTLGGSSGAGIISQSGKLIGVHTNGGCTKTGGANFGVTLNAISLVSNVVH